MTLRAFTRVPERVEAFQMTSDAMADQDTWPDWLRARWNADAMGSDAVWGRIPDAITVQSRRGSTRVLVDDWIVMGMCGLSVVNDAHFRSCYRETAVSASMATAKRRIQAGEPVTINDIAFVWAK